MPPHEPSHFQPILTSPAAYHLKPPPRMAMNTAAFPLKHGLPPAAQSPPRKQQRLLQPHHRTNPLIWCAAIVCLIFSLVLILAGIITLIVFLVIKPRNPIFDTAAASLNSIYLDSPTYLNGDLTFLANFSNPNRKIGFTFEYLSMELYFSDRLISAQALPPFEQRTGESRLQAVRMLSSEVYLTPELAAELQQQVRRNRIEYNLRGRLKVKASVGVGHFSYWLYARCQIELTAPPNGVLVAKSCITKR